MKNTRRTYILYWDCSVKVVTLSSGRCSRKVICPLSQIHLVDNFLSSNIIHECLTCTVANSYIGMVFLLDMIQIVCIFVVLLLCWFLMSKQEFDEYLFLYIFIFKFMTLSSWWSQLMMQHHACRINWGLLVLHYIMLILSFK